MERVNHIHVVQVGCRRLIGDIDRMLERQIPNRERFKLRIARLHAALMLVIQLREAGRHLSAARTRRSHDDERARRFNIIVPAISFVADNQANVGGIVGDSVLTVNLQSQRVHALFKYIRRRLSRVLRHRDGADIQPESAEYVDQARNIRIIGDAQITAAFVLLDIVRVDGDDDFCLILERKQHFNLVIRLKTGQYARRVIIVKQLAAKLQIELAAKLRDTLTNMLRLQLDVLLAVKTDLIHGFSPILRGNPPASHRKQASVQTPAKPLRFFSIPNSFHAFKGKHEKVLAESVLANDETSL